MPKTKSKPTKTVKKSKSGLSAAYKIIKRVLLIITVVIAAPFILWNLWTWWWNIGSLLGVSSRMQSYLENKYDKKFDVGFPHREGWVVGTEGSIVSKARPLDNNDITFEVYTTGTDSKHYKDRYPDALWAKDISRTVENELDVVLDKTSYVVRFGPLPSNRDDIGSVVPSYEEFYKKHEGAVYFGIEIHSDNMGREVDLQVRRNSVFSVIRFLQKQNVADPYLSYVIDGTNKHCNLGGNELKNIKVVEDITGCFK